jgi:TonB family protein
MFAVAVHAAAFAFWPSWDTLDLSLDSDLELLETEIAWISFYTMPSSGGGVAAASLALIEEPDSLPPGAEAEAETTLGGSALTGVAFSGGLYERLLGRGGGGPVPTVVEPEPVSAPLDLGDSSADTPEEEGEGVRVIVEDPAITDLALRLETSTLDLERLTGIRPELALPGTTMWLLIRNPVEVQEFMRASALRGAAEGEGEVDVTVWIDERGSVEWSEITRSSGRQEIDEIALALFDEVVSFRPAQDRGVRVSMSVIFSVAFPW